MMQLVSLICLLLFPCLSTFLEVSNPVHRRMNENEASKVAYTITVSKSGRGNFTKVLDAVNFIPSGNDQWIRIYVDSGLYWEQVKIANDKEYILLEGHNQNDTIIVYNAYQITDQSATFTSMADNFVAKSITFKNTYKSPGDVKGSSSTMKQAVAVSVYGNKSAFYNCAFVGFQDTLWDVQNRHFFKFCYIEGAIDFIWGSGQSVYEDCQINVTGDGFITAQGRNSLTDPSGFLFTRGSVFGSGSTYLGRAYGLYSRVIFRYTNLSKVVNPLGWNAWRASQNESNLIYTEVNCTGAGAKNTGRVRWEKTLDTSELPKYNRESFIDQDGWIAQQP